jgi:predicted GIY-YIG superfamily endonuclease
MNIKSDKQSELERFNELLDKVLSVPHETIKQALDKEKTEKKKKKRKKKSTSSASHGPDVS